MKAKPLSMRCDYLVFQVQQVADFLAAAVELGLESGYPNAMSWDWAVTH